MGRPSRIIPKLDDQYSHLNGIIEMYLRELVRIDWPVILWIPNPFLNSIQ